MTDPQLGMVKSHPPTEFIPSGMSNPAPPPPLVVNPNGADVPVKRKPGRPKGSGKKPIDPNAEPKIKRPVGRPRKDGLPAGSVGTFASVSQLAVYPTRSAVSNFAPGDPTQPQWRASISAPPMGSLSRGPQQMAFPIDPNLDRDDWAVLSRTRPDVFLHGLDAFKSHLASLAPNARSPNTPPIPSLYSISKTFWLPSSPVYFALTASATARTPSEHRFLYWIPTARLQRHRMPACSAPLINRGRIASGPSSPVCLAGTSPDGRRFASTDMSILRRSLPAHLLPGAADLGSAPEVWNWSPIGVSVALWNMARASLRTGMRKEALLDVHDAQQVEGDLDYAQNKPAEQFGEPWGANGPAGAPQPEAGPSHSADPRACPGTQPPGRPARRRRPGAPAPAPQGESANLLKRAFSLVGAAADADAEPLQKRIRHCCKCGSNECKGKAGAFCTNPGRNSKRPDRTCSDAWP
ncbi:hypothetical protein B0H21DRAFT_769539 [Amylocystis lapponica]|nr:hypothetical protein B0H21DRAFT_769539 [Amylocystis lapponica]